MYDYGNFDFFNLTCSTTTTDFFGYSPPEVSNTTNSTLPVYPTPYQLPHHQINHSGFVTPGELVNADFDSGSFNMGMKSEDFDSGSFNMGMKSEVCYSSSSSYGSPSSLPSCYLQRPNLVQRSMSSHSLLKDDTSSSSYHPIFSSLHESRPEIFDNLDTGPMRKVFSTGDLQGSNMVQNSGRSESPLSNENSTIDGMNKAIRYTAEERKERIERYRSKRHQRNFNKKIKYACRKTLADSRPRIRGRFARNDETGESSQGQWNQLGREENEEDEDVWLNLFEAFSNNLIP